MKVDPGDPSNLEKIHTREAIDERIASDTQHSYVGDGVLGAVDGTVTTFAIIAGAAGAGLSSGIAVVLGVANVLADAVSMAASNFLKARSDHETLSRFRKIESMHIDMVPEAEREEIEAIFRNKGFEGVALEEAVRIITSDRERWINTMLTEEWGLQLHPPSPRKAALTTFVAFLLAGSVPLLPLFANLKGSATDVFLQSSLLTAICFLGIGFVRGKVTKEENPHRSALETLLIGGVAAVLAYVVGRLLEGLA
ncbi:MAG: VIT1/CCC1 transporter family protein [Verrucomicrobiota bacterium]